MPHRDFNKRIIDERAHRPWPMPDRPWIMTQTWHDLLFAHWSLDPDALRSLLPTSFEPDSFDGRAWIGVVPFHMTNVGARGVPVPGISAFPELNVRTYVHVDDKPGVYFFSLDAGSLLAVRIARMVLNLPYYKAAMAVQASSSDVVYESRRTGYGPAAELRVRYGPDGTTFNASPGSLEHFLTERYCLYAVDHGGRPYRLQIHHPPWPLQPARATFTTNTMTAAAGIALSGEAPLLHFSKRQDMVGWPPERLRGG